VLLLGMLTAFGVVLGVRPRTPHRSEINAAPSTPSLSFFGASSASASASGAASAPGPAGSGAASAAPPGSGPPGVSAPIPSGSAAPAAPLLDRALKVSTLGWELAMPVLVANQGTEPGSQGEFARAGLEVKVSVSERGSALENALARGGADKDGADIVILPLSGFIASYERLRALNPEVFLVTGWSRGRDALLASKDLLTGPLPAELSLAGGEGEASTMLGLLTLDLLGVQPKLLPLARASETPLEAVDRSVPGEPAHQRVLLTSAQATRLLPYVAVAPRSFLEQKGPAVAVWARGWLAGQRQVEADTPGAARLVAGLPGAPGPLPLLRGLGELQPANLGDNARSMGLSGRGVLTLDALFQRSWRAWKSAGVLTSSAPEVTPLTTSVVAGLARAESGPLTPAHAAAPKLASDKDKPVLVYRQKEGQVDEPALLEALAFLGGAFDRATLRVTIRKGITVDTARTKKLVDQAAGELDLGPRVQVGSKAPEKSGAAIEVVPAP
jgi:hypothetical protein